MPLSNALQFRAMVIHQARDGTPVKESVVEFGVSESTVHRRVRKDRIDRGDLTGTSTAENAELGAALARIGELEAELATVNRAVGVACAGVGGAPKALYPIAETLAAEDRGTKRDCRLAEHPYGWLRTPLRRRTAARRA